jgi:lactate 2-monooxygenase
MTDGEPYGRRRQAEIYAMGKAGQPPAYPIGNDELRVAAREALDEDAWAYLAGGAGEEDTVDENRRAFRRWRVVPRMLRDVAERDLSVSVAGLDLPAPVMCAPVGMQSLFDERGDVASAEGAAAAGVPFVASSVSSETMEAIADAGDGPQWFQLYWSAEEAVADSFLERAEAAGYDAVVVTVDTPVTGWRQRELRQAALPFFDGHGMANYLTDDAFRAGMDADPDENHDMAVQHLLDTFADAGRTWADLAGLVERTDLPVFVKGILHPADARAAVDAGADGVVVSNHGGRQVDGSLAALDALPDVAAAVGDDVGVLFDSGVRGGADVVRALALGADAALLGRPYLYGLAVGGVDGVATVCRNYLADVDLTLGLAGYAAASAVDRAAVREVPRAAGRT